MWKMHEMTQKITDFILETLKDLIVVTAILLYWPQMD